MNMQLPPFGRARAGFAPVLLLLLGLATPAAAADGPPALPEKAQVPASGFGAALSEASLGALRGGDQVENKVDIHGTVEGNSAEDIVSGDNRVQGGAFGNAAGINTLIQNTGSNVLIQNGMTVNVQFADPGTPQ